MDPLQYFDEEYNHLKEITSIIDSFFLEYKDAYSSLLDIQKRVIEFYSQKKFDSESLKYFLQLLEDFIHKCGTTLSSFYEFKDSLSKQ